MADRLHFGSVAIDNEGGLALIVFTPTGQSRYVDITAQQAATTIALLAAALVDPRRLRAEVERQTDRLAEVEAACSLAEDEARHVVDDEVYVSVGLIRNVLNGVV